MTASPFRAPRAAPRPSFKAQSLRHRGLRALGVATAALLVSGCAGNAGSPWYSSLLGKPDAQATAQAAVDYSAPPPVYTPPAPTPVEVTRPAPIAAQRPAGVQVASAAPAQRAVPGAPPRVHVVRPGDTVYSLARRYGTTPAAIQQLNNLDAAFSINVDQQLALPVAGVAPQAAAYAPPTAAAPRPAAALPTGAPTQLLRPVDGQIVSRFGETTGATVNDGVGFAAEPGAPVRAAADGKVAYVSDDSGPLGSVVLLQHGGGHVTIYGRVAQASVRPGQMIRAGEPFARVAAPRSGGKALLHFELRRGSEPIDPSRFL